MSVHAASSASPPWQTLAELRASGASPPDPAPVGTPSTASSGAALPSGGSNAIASGIAAPAPGLLQFLQQFQSATGTTPESGTDGAASGTGPASSGTSTILGELQSLFTQLQQGLSGSTDTGASPPTGAAPATTGSLAPYTGAAPATGASGASGSVNDGTQTGNDLALQVLTGFPGAAGGLFGLGA